MGSNCDLTGVFQKNASPATICRTLHRIVESVACPPPIWLTTSAAKTKSVNFRLRLVFFGPPVGPLVSHVYVFPLPPKNLTPGKVKTYIVVKLASEDSLAKWLHLWNDSTRNALTYKNQEKYEYPQLNRSRAHLGRKPSTSPDYNNNRIAKGAKEDFQNIPLSLRWLQLTTLFTPRDAF